MTNGRNRRPRPPQPVDEPLADPVRADHAGVASPRQLAAGFAIVAALIVLLVGRRRGRGPGHDGRGG
jgi:hypothetical protein